MIFDDPAELERRKRPVMVRSGRGPFRPARPRRARDACFFFLEHLRNPARSRRAGLMRQFRSSQLDSNDDAAQMDTKFSTMVVLVLNLVLNLEFSI